MSNYNDSKENYTDPVATIANDATLLSLRVDEMTDRELLEEVVRTMREARELVAQFNAQMSNLPAPLRMMLGAK